MLYTVGDTTVYMTWCLSSRRLWYLSFRDRFLMKQKITVSRYMLLGSIEKRNVEQTD